MSQSFLSVLSMLSVWVFSHLLDMEKSHSQFLDFFQRELLHVQLYIQCIQGRKEVQQPPISPFQFLFGIFTFFLFFFFSQKELEKQKRIKRNQQLEAIAKEHYERVLLRKKGLEPWKRLRMQSMQNLQVQCHTLTHLPPKTNRCTFK